MAGLFVVITTANTFLTGYMLAKMGHIASVVRKLTDIVAEHDNIIEGCVEVKQED